MLWGREKEIFCEFLMFVEQGEAKLVEHKTKGWTNPNETTPFWTFLWYLIQRTLTRIGSEIATLPYLPLKKNKVKQLIMARPHGWKIVNPCCVDWFIQPRNFQAMEHHKRWNGSLRICLIYQRGQSKTNLLKPGNK